MRAIGTDTFHKCTQNARNTQNTQCRWEDTGRWRTVPICGPIRKAVLALPGRTSRPERQPSLPPFAVRLWPNESSTNSRTPPRTIAPRAARLLTQTRPLRAKRKSGQETVTGQAGHRLLLVYPPLPPGAIIAREPQCRRERRCPESAYINIIPSGLCNKSARAPLVSASHTIRIMLSTLRQ